MILPLLQKIGRQAKVVKTINGKSTLIRLWSIVKPFNPEKILQLPRIRSWLSKLLPITLPIARSVFPYNAAIIEVTSSGREVPVATIVRPIIISFTPNRVAKDWEPFTRIFEPKLKRKIPEVNFNIIFNSSLSMPGDFSISGSAFFVSSSFSLIVFISVSYTHLTLPTIYSV